MLDGLTNFQVADTIDIKYCNSYPPITREETPTQSISNIQIDKLIPQWQLEETPTQICLISKFHEIQKISKTIIRK